MKILRFLTLTQSQIATLFRTFSLLTLTSAVLPFFQRLIPVSSKDIPKTSVITPFGLFEYLGMYYGLRNGVQTLQLFINTVMSDVPFFWAYTEDLLIASSNQEEHKTHLCSTYSWLNEIGILVNPEKYLFCVPSLTFLYYTVSAEGVLPLQDHVKAILFLLLRDSQKQHYQFLRMVNFYYSFLITQQLPFSHDHLRSKKKVR